jgi:hypothetical protein
LSKKRTNLILLAGAGVVVIGIAAYFLFARSGYVEGRPTLMYFRHKT